MKALRALIFAGAVLVISACATMAPPKSPQEAINQANVVLIAVDKQIADNVTNGIMTKAEAQAAFTQAKQYGVEVDAAQALLDNGNAIAAQDKAKLVSSLILQLQRQVAEKARENK